MNGHLTSVTLNTGDTLWTLRKQRARLLPTKVRLGRLGLSLSYDDRGNVRERWVADRQDNDVQWLEYEYSAGTGNMTGRTDWTHGTEESFDYDNLNRLTGIEWYDYPSAGYLCHSTVYDGKGNITSHSTAGQYGYGTARPYAFNELMSPSPLIPLRDQHISFNAMQRPDTIREGNYVATFDYYGDMSRALMTVTDTITHNTETRTYYDQQYNEFTKTAGNSTQTKRVLWLGGTPYDAPAALVKRYGEQDWTLVHVLRDNLGSITHVVDTTGTVLQEMGYSAWGLLRDVESLEPYAPASQPELLLGRGYTGHEHLPWFGLVNMNARLYDPAVGRFLSPDPLVQAPDNTQNYNRYSYCLNNPLRYRDENGEFFLGLLIGFFKGLFTGQNVFKTAWKTGVNETKILAGQFAFDKPSNFGDAICKFFSRFVYEGSQTSIGLIVSLGKNLFSDIDNVEYYRGATYLIDFGASHKNGMTIGSYININSPQKDANSSEVYSEGSFNPTNDEMFVHEYGHYLQSQKYGPFYLPAFAIPSLYSAWKNSESKHVNFYTEIDASTRAAAFWGFSYSEWFERYKNDADPLYPGMLEWYLSYYNR